MNSPPQHRVGPGVSMQAGCPVMLSVTRLGMWPFGLACVEERRRYVTTPSRQALNAVTGIMQ